MRSLTHVRLDEDLRMIMGPPPANEPGCWNYLVGPLAEHYGLSPERLPLEEWKQYRVWEDYRAMVDAQISQEAHGLLEFLESGRPLLGSGIEYDGCMFAWLTAAETESLLQVLSAADAEKFDERYQWDDLDEFHEELVESLQEAVDRNAELFLGAH